jgi:hypothetical protein
MNTVEIDHYKKRLQHLFERAKEFAAEPELQSHWSRYLCVLVSGFLEVAVQTLFAEYAKGKATPSVSNFVDAQVSRFQNPKMERILELTRAFSPEWAEELDEATGGELKDAVDSIVANRHKIAHGESVGISLSRISQYYRDAVKVVNLIEAQLGD